MAATEERAADGKFVAESLSGEAVPDEAAHGAAVFARAIIMRRNSAFVHLEGEAEGRYGCARPCPPRWRVVAEVRSPAERP